MRVKNPTRITARKNFWIGITIALLSALGFVRTWFENQEAMLLPRVVLILSIVVGLLLAGLPGRADSEYKKRLSLVELLFPLALIAVVLLIPILGFYLSLTLFSVILGIVFSRSRSPLSLVMASIWSILLMAVIYLIFSVLLGIRTPKGVLI